ncbi:unnamed protein product [Cuscuta campestris]|uniref:Uncharacterized protein n=1 Tax=Cuscuta campestris TaxID=132261 RepID=A0A484NF86_9ASTE|nr:unnamed protein product [Cuscuta campestris]
MAGYYFRHQLAYTPATRPWRRTAAGSSSPADKPNLATEDGGEYKLSNRKESVWYASCVLSGVVSQS